MDWPNKNIPRVCAGVYSIYDANGKFLYVGMAGASLTKDKVDTLMKIPGRKSGLLDRLGAHASGYRSGDRFNIYICDLFVLSTLTKEQIHGISQKKLSLDSINKQYIRQELSYKYLVTENALVRNLETHIKANGINGIRPSINPSL